jgi:mannose-6-phosphate isomerase mannose-1-phosphate guanylyl transferase
VHISIEPCRRDTFPAIALVSEYLHEVRDAPFDESVAICPADPYVDEDYFHAVLQLFEEVEREGGFNIDATTKVARLTFHIDTPIFSDKIILKEFKNLLILCGFSVFTQIL